MKQLVEIKVGICIAYDWEMLKISLPIVYPYADKICLALDKNRKTWAGNNFEFDTSSFLTYVKEIDQADKIDIYEDDFSIDSSNPMKCEIYQRNKMAEVLGDGGWHIQIDVDEYFLNIQDFVKFLKKKHDIFSHKNINISLPVYTLFKTTVDGFFIIKGQTEWFTIATNKPNYEFGRRNSYRNFLYNSPIIHQSWARECEEIFQKVNNWGHKNDFDVHSFFNRWKTLNDKNYKNWLNFHPIDSNIWKELILVKAKNIEELIKTPEKLIKVHTYIKLDVILRNNRFIAKLLQFLHIK